MTQGKIERYHRSMKNVIKLLNYEYPGELEQAIDEFVEYYNKQRYHEALDNLTPEDVYLGREKVVQTRREKIKEATLSTGENGTWGLTLVGRGPSIRRETYSLSFGLVLPQML
jgi:hypothetical protein